ncbi:MAG: beta-ketoacyl-ACP synthase II [Anaerolineales bacterium]|nr:beta-ketoacyl-ACP synthase II [Anaerolineales bacterium]
MRRVVVTGMGTISPLGNTVEETWGNVVEGVSGVGPITRFETDDLMIQIACEVKGFDPEDYMEKREARRIDRFQQFGIAAAEQAIQSAGLELRPEEASRASVIISSAVGGILSLEEGMVILTQQGPRRVTPFIIPKFMANGAAGLVSIKNGFKGPTFSLASACASGSDAIGQAAQMIRAGFVDVAAAGAADATISRIGLSGFDRLGAMSRQNQDYSATPAPFDKNRDGLVMGEGAAVLVLEELERARARGAEILAELVGYGSTSDSYHITAPAEDGAGGAAAIAGALAMAEVSPDQVDYISAHGTATVLNDLSETRAIKAAFGDAAYNTPISSTKSMTGHMMGATAALEAIFCILAIRDDVIPPTIHYHTPDPECDLDYVPNEARQVKVNLTISNAFGFGGHNAVLAFQAFSS